MSDYSTFKSTIAEWANRSDWSDALVSSFVTMAEQVFNAQLRVDRMIETAQNIVTGRCSTLPDNWLEMDFVSFANSNAANGWMPIRYKSRDEFFNSVDSRAFGYYTIEGRELTFGGAPDAVNGLAYKISYYGEVPVFADDCPSFIYTKYPTLYLQAALMHADLHAVGEEDKAQFLRQQVEAQIQKLNDNHRLAKASGSRLKRSRVRSFG